MYYAALVILGLSVLMLGLDFGGVRVAHGAGPAATMLMLVALGILAAKTFAVHRRHSS